MILYTVSYVNVDSENIKPVVFTTGEIKTPPFTTAARYEAGKLMRLLQNGVALGMPQSRPMPGIGPGCHELRVRDEEHHWRILYHLSRDAVVVIGVFAKKSETTPVSEIEKGRKRLAEYLALKK